MIGLVDVDGGKFPNYALMKIARYYRDQGEQVEWADAMFGHYDKVFMSKIFTFSEDCGEVWNCEDMNEAYERLSHFRNNRRVRVVAQPFRDFNNPRQVIPQWQRDMARWAMRREYWTTCEFKEFEPRKGFKCKEYFY